MNDCVIVVDSCLPLLIQIVESAHFIDSCVLLRKTTFIFVNI